MAVTREEHDAVLRDISNLRVDLASTIGELKVTNERLNGLITVLNARNREASIDRRWAIGLIATVIVSAVAIILTRYVP
jgi:hypothetical protein